MIYYIRDNENNVIGFIYNGETYYYKKNIQQDVIGIYDSTFNQIVTYTYDSWGNKISIVDTSTNNIGTINPYRYRSYYYDNETELYYLNTRYYNPKWKRFINADGIIGANDCITNSNLYFYANNNPISYSDSEGTVSIIDIINAGIKAGGAAIGAIMFNSERLFLKSIFNPKYTHYGNNSTISNKLKKTKTMKNEIQKNLEDFKKSGLTSKTYSNKLSFYDENSLSGLDAKFFYGSSSRNYYMHISKDYRTIKYGAFKQLYGMYKVDVTVYDDYNFNSPDRPWTSLSGAANNLGYYLQEMGISKNYSWDASFTMYYETYRMW